MAKQKKQEPVLRDTEPKVIKRMEPTPIPRENIMLRQEPIEKVYESVSVKSQRDTGNVTPGFSYKLKKD